MCHLAFMFYIAVLGILAYQSVHGFFFYFFLPASSANLTTKETLMTARDELIFLWIMTIIVVIAVHYR